MKDNKNSPFTQDEFLSGLDRAIAKTRQPQVSTPTAMPEDDESFGTNFGQGFEIGGKSFIADINYAVADLGAMFTTDDTWSEKMKLWSSEYKKTAPEADDSWGQFLGSLVPSIIPTAGAIAAAPFTGGTSAAIAASSVLGLSSMGSGMMEYDRYKKEKGEVADPSERLGVGVLYGLAEYIPERIGLGMLVPKGTGKLVMKGDVSKAIEPGKRMLTKIYEQNPKRVGNIIQSIGKASTIEGVQESITEVLQLATDTTYKEMEDMPSWGQITKNIGQAFLGGAIMGGAIGPLSYASNNIAQSERRKRQGQVIMAEDTDTGDVVEIVGSKKDKGTYQVITPAGAIEDIPAARIGQTFKFTPEQFNNLLKSKHEVSKEEERIKYNEQEQIFKQQEAQFRQLQQYAKPDDDGNPVIIMGKAMQQGTEIPLMVTNQIVDQDGKLFYAYPLSPNPNGPFFIDLNSKPIAVDPNMLIEREDVPLEDFRPRPITANPESPVIRGETFDFNGQRWTVTNRDTTTDEIQLKSEDGEYQTVTQEQYQQLRTSTNQQPANIPIDEDGNIKPAEEAVEQPQVENATTLQLEDKEIQVLGGEVQTKYSKRKQAESDLAELQELYSKENWEIEDRTPDEPYAKSEFVIVNKREKNDQSPGKDSGNEGSYAGPRGQGNAINRPAGAVQPTNQPQVNNAEEEAQKTPTGEKGSKPTEAKEGKEQRLEGVPKEGKSGVQQEVTPKGSNIGEKGETTPDQDEIRERRNKKLDSIKSDGKSRKDRKKIIALNRNSGKSKEEILTEAGYIEVDGLFIEPDADMDIIKRIPTELWNVMKENGIVILSFTSKGNHHMMAGSITLDGVKYGEIELTKNGLDNLEHNILHEVGHKVYQSLSKEEQVKFDSYDNPVTPYVASEERNQQSGASNAEENFVESYALDMKRRIYGQNHNKGLNNQIEEQYQKLFDKINAKYNDALVDENKQPTPGEKKKSGKVDDKPESKPKNADPKAGAKVSEAVKVIRYVDAYKENGAPLEEDPATGRLKRMGSLDTHGIDSDETGRKVRWYAELSDGRKVSLDGVIRITDPEAWEQSKDFYRGLRGDEKQRALMSDTLDYQMLLGMANELRIEAKEAGFKENDFGQPNFDRWLKEIGHPFQHLKNRRITSKDGESFSLTQTLLRLEENLMSDEELQLIKNYEIGQNQDDAPQNPDNNQEEIEQKEEKVKITDNSPEAILKRGSYTRDGVTYTRQQPIAKEVGRKAKVKFATNVSVDSNYTLIEASDLQPSHRDGQKNPLHFIGVAQPKDRSTGAGRKTASGMRTGLDPEELGPSVNAYFGPPVVNSRGEVIQGNGRADGIIQYLEGNPGDPNGYRDFLIENKDVFGINEDQVSKMKNPVLVRMVEGSDQSHIKLGQYTANDLESGGSQVIVPQATFRKLSDKQKESMMRMLSEAEGDTMNQMVRSIAGKAVSYLQKEGIINETQAETVISSRTGAINKDGIGSLTDVFLQFVFDGGDMNLPRHWKSLDFRIEEALSKAFPSVFKPGKNSLLPELQLAIVGYVHFKNSGFPSVQSWANSPDMFKGGITPAQEFTPLGMRMIEIFNSAGTQKEVKELFDNYSRLVSGLPPDLYNPNGTPGKSPKDAVNEIFKINYDPITNEVKRKINTSEDLEPGQGDGQAKPKDVRFQKSLFAEQEKTSGVKTKREQLTDKLKIATDRLRYLRKLPAPAQSNLVKEEIMWLQKEIIRLNNNLENTLSRDEATKGGQQQTLFQRAAPTESKAFKDWFGDSKVVDENGNPLVVYHGTPEKFTQFDPKKPSWETRLNQQGPGFYFTDNKREAKSYGKPMEVYLSIQNPLELTRYGSGNITDDQAYNILIDGDYEWFYTDALPFLTGSKGLNLSKEELVRKYVSQLKTDKDKAQNLTRAYNDKSLLLANVKKHLNVDGFYEKVSDRTKVYVAIEPTQIKSATGNRGTYDPTNPDIRFQTNPDQVTFSPEFKRPEWIQDVTLANGVSKIYSPFKISRKAKVEEHVKKLTKNWKNAPRIVVWESSIDAIMSGEIKGLGMDMLNGFNAAFDPNTNSVHIVADAIDNGKYRFDSATDIESTILHELVGHYGLKGMLRQVAAKKGTEYQKEYNSLMDEVYEAYKDSDLMQNLINRGYAKRRGQTDAEYHRELAEEYIAHTAETGIDATLLDKIIAFFRKLARELTGSYSKIGDAEIKSIISNSRRFLQVGDNFINRADFKTAYQRQVLGVQDIQFQRTDTREFKRWFQGSKVVDENGNPMMLLHGTGEDFDSFQPNNEGGIFFTKSATIANIYAGWGVYPNVMPVYMNLQNPMEVDFTTMDETLMPFPGELGPYIIEAKKKGHDGLLVKGFIDAGGKQDQYVAFEPNQIKSAIGNRGTFDDSGDIRFQKNINFENYEIQEEQEGQGVRSRALQEATRDNFQAAFTYIRGNEGSTGENPQVADQHLRAKEYAQENNMLINSPNELGEPTNFGGMENKIYLNADEQTIYKSNNLYVHNGDILSYINYIQRHNHLFPTTLYELVGFQEITKNKELWMKPIVKQKYLAGYRKATQEEIDAGMRKRGYYSNDRNTYSYENGEFEISDLKPANVLFKDGEIFVVDNVTKKFSAEDLRFQLSPPVESEAFRNWFGDSKVVDESGSPKVMYHGTPNATFDQFNNLPHFTDNPQYAERYTNQGASSIQYKKQAESPAIYPVYLSIKKPFDTRDKKAKDIFINEYQAYYSPELSERGLVDWMEAEDLAEWLQENYPEYDGIYADEGGEPTSEGVSLRGITVIPFSSTQIKSATGNQGTYDPTNPDIRFQLSQPVEQTRDLVAMHNLTVKSLKNVDKIGGLPMPSLAITRSSIPFESFGDISLIADKAVIDPRGSGNRVFGADAYSPRYPMVEYTPKLNRVREVFGKYEDDVPKGISSWSDNVKDAIVNDGFDYAKKEPLVQIAYLKETGKSVPKLNKLPKPKVDKSLVDYYNKKNQEDPQWRYHDYKFDPELQKLVRKAKKEEYKASPGIWERLYGNDKELEPHVMSHIMRDVEKVVNGRDEYDTVTFRGELQKKTSNRKFDEWFDQKMEELDIEEKLFAGFSPSGTRKYLPHTVENVIKLMRRESIRGGEAWNYGVGSLRAKLTPEFKSLKQIQDSRNRLVSKEEFEKVKEEISDQYMDLLERWRSNDPQSRENSFDDRMSYMLMDAAVIGLPRSIKEYGLDIDGISDDLLTDTKDFFNKLVGFPTEYFEAKPNRAVPLSDFRLAMVPKGTPKDVRDILQKNGIKAVTYDRSVEGDRQAKLNEALDRSTNADIRFQRSLTSPTDNFYSNSLKAVREIGQPKGTFDQWKSMLLKNGASQAELDWMDFDSQFANRKSITKEELQEFIQMNQIDVVDVVKGAQTPNYILPKDENIPDELGIDERDLGEAIYKVGDINTDRFVKFLELRGFDNAEEIADWARGNIEQQGTYDKDTKYSQYVVPGGENYKELLLTMPRKKAPDPDFNKEDGVWVATINGKEIGRDENITTLRERIGADYMSMAGGNQYKSSHFDEPNILAHVRFDERTVNGEKTLFINELQSDWSQEGRKKGYGETLNKDQVEILEVKDIPAGGKVFTVLNKITNLKNSHRALSEEEAINKEIESHKNINPGVSNMPFKQTSQWLNLSIRRMIRYASENGFDRVALITGEQAADLYDLSKQVDSITATPKDDGTYDLSIGLKGVDRSEKYQNQTPEQMEELIGKEITQKIINNEGEQLPRSSERMRKSYIYEGVDLQVGGEGMKAFYNKIVPSTTSKLLKKLDKEAKVEVISLNKETDFTIATRGSNGNFSVRVINEENPNSSSETATGFKTSDEASEYGNTVLLPKALQQQLSFPITPKMRTIATEEGLPLFQRSNMLQNTSEQYAKIAQRAGQKWDEVRIKLQDTDLPVKRVLQEVYGDLKNVPDYANPYHGLNVMGPKAEAKSREFFNDFSVPMLEVAKDIQDNHGAKYDESSDYIYARAAIARNKEFVDRAIEERKTKLKNLGESAPKAVRTRLTNEIAELEAGNFTRPSLQTFENSAGMTNQEAQGIIDAYEAKVPEKQVKALIKAKNRIVKYLAEQEFQYGLIDEKKFRARIKNKEYAPLRGFADSEYDPTRISGDYVAKGRKSKADDPIMYLNVMAQTVFHKGEQNAVKQQMLAFVEENPKSELFKIKSTWYLKNIKEDGSEEFIETSEKPKGNFKVTIDPEKDKVVSTTNPLETESINVLVNGRKVKIEFYGKKGMRVAKSLQGQSTDKVSKMFSYVRSFNRKLAQFYTTYSPEFVMRNLLRDLITVGINIRNDHGSKVSFEIYNRVPNALKTLKKAIRDDDYSGKYGTYLKEFEMGGGFTGYQSLKDMEEYRKGAEKFINEVKNPVTKTKEMWDKSFKFIDDYNRVVENGARLATYVTLRERGVSKDKAIAQAKDVSVNFNRRGEWSSNLGALYLFVNAGIQGTERLTRAFFNTDSTIRKRALMTAVALPAFSIAMSMLNRLIEGEDEDGEFYYDKLPDYVRQHNLSLPNIFSDRPGDFLQIPLPYGFNVFFAIPDHFVRYLMGKESASDMFLNTFSVANSSFNPLGGVDMTSEKASVYKNVIRLLAPTVVDPWVDQAFNENFAAMPIYPETFPGATPKPNSQRYFSNVNPIFRDLAYHANKLTGGDEEVGGYLDVSPETIEHFVGSYGGGVFTFANNMTTFMQNLYSDPVNVASFKDDKIEKVPIVRNYIEYPRDWIDQSNFYNVVTQVKRAEDIYDRYIERGDRVRANEYRRENEHLFNMVGLTKNFEKQNKNLSNRIALLENMGTDGKKAAESLEKQQRNLYIRYLKRYQRYKRGEQPPFLTDLFGFLNRN